MWGSAFVGTVAAAATLFGFAQPPALDSIRDVSAVAQATAPAVSGATTDRAVDGRGDADGYHVRVTSAATGYAWSDIAVLRPASLDPGSWYGYQCVTSDGKFVAVAVLPGDAINSNVARDHGAFAYAIDVSNGAVKALGTGVGLKYHSPQCGLDDTAVFTSNPGANERITVSTRYNLSSGKQVSQSVVEGQVTSVVPTSHGMVGAYGTDLVSLPSSGSVRAPAAIKKLVAAGGAPFDLRPASDGGVDFVAAAADGATTVQHMTDGKTKRIGSGSIGSTHLFLGTGGHNIVTGAKSSGGLAVADAGKLPLGADNVTLGASAAFGESPTQVPAKSGKVQSQADLAASASAPLVEVARSQRVFQTSVTDRSTKSAKSTGPTVQGGGATRNSTTQPAPKEAKRTAFTGVGPLNPSISAAVDLTARPALSSGATTPTCSVARLQPNLQAMQPSNAQVDWATQMAEQGLLTGAAYTRPANYANMGLVAYAPSDDFSPIALEHPASDTWSTVPRSVMVAIESQESNFNQASWHALPGIAGDPLIADYYGAGDAIDTIDYPNADCGYGVAQVTTGMHADDTSISQHGQMKVAVDYEENISAGLNILQETWNQLYEAGITANGGDPRYLENWYFAAWAYNTGIQPTAAFGNTTGCTPGPSCTGPDGTWGLGWSNNPRNPDYDPNRAPYLKNTYGDAAHPSSWPYQERILGWMGSPLVRYGYTAYDTPTYNGGSTWLQIPGFNSMCTTDNHCDPANAAGGYCALGDSECWWHQPVTWVASCSTTCATAAYEDGAGSTQPSYADPYPPTCNQDTSKVPSGSIIVDDLTTPAQNLQGCSGMNWGNNGTFAYSPGTNSSGDPVGNIDTHQLGSGFGGHILFTHTEPASSTSLINTGTWTPTLPSLQYYKVKIHIPMSGATATDVVYTINPGGSASPWKIRVNQDWQSEQWVTIGTFAMQNGGNVQLTNTSAMTPQGYDVAFDAIAFVPQGGTPGQPIGGPPGIQDAPKGSNPAWVNCGCVRRTAGDPVDTATGYFGETLTDLSTPGLGEALNVTRTYSSSLADPAGPAGAAAVNGAFGHGWTFNYGMSATTGTGGAVTVHQEDGSSVPFTLSGTTYTPSAPRFDATLFKSGTTYVFTRHATDQFTFDVTTGHLLKISDPAGRAASTPYATVLAYDASNNLHTVTDPAGRAYTFTWTGSHITKVTSAAGQEVDYFYNTGGNLADVYGVGTLRPSGVNGDQDHTQYVYNTLNLMTSQRSPDNYGKTTTPTPVTSMTYDTSERVLTQTDALGKVTNFTYGPNAGAGLTAGQNLVTDPVGHKTLFVYQNGLLTSLTKGYGATGASTWSYAYDPVTLGVSVQTNPDGSTQTFAYDDAGHVISSSDGLGRTTSTQYDAAGKVTQSTDPTGVHTTTVYNAAEKPTSVTVSLSGQSAESANDVLNPSYARASSYAYTDAAHPGEATTFTNANSHATGYGYDAFGDLTTLTDSQSHVTKYGYDTTRGWKTSMVTPVGVAAGVAPGCTPPAKGCTTYAYDAYEHVTTTTDPLGHTIKATFDADGNQLTSTDGNNHTTTTTYDAVDRPTKVQKPSTDATVTVYNDDGTINKVTDAASHNTSYIYDAQARVTSSTNQDNKTTGYTYDGMGRLKTTTKPNSDVVTQTWDNAGQLTGIAYSGTSTPAAGYTYDLDGRRTTMTDGTGTSTYSYDSFGENTSVTTGSGATTSYAYDAVGNTTAITYPTVGTKVTRHFNTLEQLDSVTDPGGGVSSFGYNADGAPTTIGYANGDTSTVTYDNADQPATSALTRAAAALGTITYGRDNTGDLNATTPSAGAPGLATTYGYNTNQYLTGSTVGSTTTAYSYDSIGDPTKVGSANQVFDPAGQLCWTTTSTVTSPTCGSPATGATTYGYDANGNRTGKTPSGSTATTYAYNAAGELTGVSGGASATYAYNGDGLRSAKTTGSTTLTFTWDARSKIPQLLSDGTTDYVYGPTGTPVEQFTAGGANPVFYFADAHGSTTELTNAAGAVAGSYAYSPWGVVTSHSGITTAIQFAGAYADSETGLVYLQARYYDPATAIFVSVDALVSRTLAAYLYTSNNPLNRLDPLGLWGWGDTWALIGGIGLAIGVIALAATGVGLFADAGLLALAVGVDAAETIGTVAAVTSVAGGVLSVGLDGASCYGGGDQGACGAMVANAVGTGMGEVGIRVGRSGIPGAKQLGVAVGINSIPYSGFGFGLDVNGFIAACHHAQEGDG
jgi:RHS repeat-associated protein